MAHYSKAHAVLFYPIGHRRLPPKFRISSFVSLENKVWVINFVRDTEFSKIFFCENVVRIIFINVLASPLLNSGHDPDFRRKVVVAITTNGVIVVAITVAAAIAMTITITIIFLLIVIAAFVLLSCAQGNIFKKGGWHIVEASTAVMEDVDVDVDDFQWMTSKWLSRMC